MIISIYTSAKTHLILRKFVSLTSYLGSSIYWVIESEGWHQSTTGYKWYLSAAANTLKAWKGKWKHYIKTSYYRWQAESSQRLRRTHSDSGRLYIFCSGHEFIWRCSSIYQGWGVMYCTLWCLAWLSSGIRMSVTIDGHLSITTKKPAATPLQLIRD